MTPDTSAAVPVPLAPPDATDAPGARGTAGEPPPAPQPRVLQQAAVAATVAMALLGAYDTLVRQPRTPRLAVVDVARLYELAQDRAMQRVLRAAEAVEDTTPSATSPAVSTPAAATRAGDALAQLHRLPQSFGPALSTVLKDLADQCRCTLVAMASVFGADATVPDFTETVAARLGLAPLGATASGTAPGTATDAEGAR